MHYLTIPISTLAMATLAIAAPTSANDPPTLAALFQELRDFRCLTGGLHSRAIITPDVGKCLKFKNPLDTSGVKLTYLAPECNCS